LRAIAQSQRDSRRQRPGCAPDLCRKFAARQWHTSARRATYGGRNRCCRLDQQSRSVREGRRAPLPGQSLCFLPARSLSPGVGVFVVKQLRQREEMETEIRMANGGSESASYPNPNSSPNEPWHLRTTLNATSSGFRDHQESEIRPGSEPLSVMPAIFSAAGRICW